MSDAHDGTNAHSVVLEQVLHRDALALGAASFLMMVCCRPSVWRPLKMKIVNSKKILARRDVSSSYAKQGCLDHMLLACVPVPRQ